MLEICRSLRRRIPFARCLRRTGTVETLALITDRETGNPRGFGFVEMANADAARAMQALNGSDFDGRALRINEAQAKERSGGGDRGGQRRY